MGTKPDLTKVVEYPFFTMGQLVRLGEEAFRSFSNL
jgi:hypothetical protein